MIYICSNSLDKCTILVEHSLRKPRAFALDPTRGYLFFTKWGHSSPMLERCNMDGTKRKALVTEKIVFPYGVTIDYATTNIYWLDTYLDFIERIDYEGKNRKTILRGKQAQNLYGITVFEQYLYVSSWHNHNIIAVNKRTKEAHSITKSDARPYNIHVFHRQRQPDGEFLQ